MLCPICHLGESDEMICCDVCERWLHLHCVGLNSHEAQKVDYYVCPLHEQEPPQNEDEACVVNFGKMHHTSLQTYAHRLRLAPQENLVVPVLTKLIEDEPKTESKEKEGNRSTTRQRSWISESSPSAFSPDLKLTEESEGKSPYLGKGKLVELVKEHWSALKVDDDSDVLLPFLIKNQQHNKLVANSLREQDQLAHYIDALTPNEILEYAVVKFVDPSMRARAQTAQVEKAAPSQAQSQSQSESESQSQSHSTSTSYQHDVTSHSSSSAKRKPMNQGIDPDSKRRRVI